MTFGYVYDGPPAKCAKGPRPGTKALRDGVMERFGCGDDGIFNCRPTRNKGSKTLSFHADGRAWDARCTDDLNRRIAAWLVEWADVLGIQEVISYRRRWDSKTRLWRVYTGDDPHTGHVHAAQCIRAANSLTLATVRAIEHGAPGPIPPEEDDMKMTLYQPDFGPDKGMVFLVGPVSYEYIGDPKAESELERQWGKPVAINAVAWDHLKSGIESAKAVAVKRAGG